MATITKTRAARLSIGDLSRRSGVHVETIRYYERIALLTPPPRSAGGHRIYDPDDAKRLNFIRRARELGFTLEQIRKLLSLVDGGTNTCDEVKLLALDQRNTIQRKIADLKKIDRILKRMVAACEHGAVPDCPIVEALFRPEPVDKAARDLTL